MVYVVDGVLVRGVNIILEKIKELSRQKMKQLVQKPIYQESQINNDAKSGDNGKIERSQELKVKRQRLKIKITKHE
ncbi:hypothetical protein Tco_0213350 [Tanacetum coccineum]